MTEADQADFENATCCHICKQTIQERLTRDSEITIARQESIVAVLMTDATQHMSLCLPVMFQKLTQYHKQLSLKEAFEINKELGNRIIDAMSN